LIKKLCSKPYIIINCAMSADGKIALPDKKQLRISSEEDIKRVHRLRNSVDAVLVGIGTILTDNPKLTVKKKYVKKPKNPVKVILDSKCQIPDDANVLRGKTIILTTTSTNRFKDRKDVEIIKCKSKKGFVDLEDALSKLSKKGIKNILVEGGGTVIWSFIKSGYVDDIYIYMNPMIIGGKDTPTVADGEGIKSSREIIKLDLVGYKKLGDGVLFHYRIKQ